MFAINEFCRASSGSRPNPACRRAFFISEFQFSAFQLYPIPLFPRNPPFPALRYSPTSVQEPDAKNKFLAVACALPPGGMGYMYELPED